MPASRASLLVLPLVFLVFKFREGRAAAVSAEQAA